MASKLDSLARKQQILDEALRQAAKVGYLNIKRQEIATALGISAGLVSLHFSTMAQLKRDVMRAAVKHSSSPTMDRMRWPAWRVLAQGLAVNDRQAMRARADVKANALATLA